MSFCEFLGVSDEEINHLQISVCLLVLNVCGPVTVCCSVMQCDAVCWSVLQCVCGVLQHVAVCCSMLQSVAECCSVLQCIAVVSVRCSMGRVVLSRHQHCPLCDKGNIVLNAVS